MLMLRVLRGAAASILVAVVVATPVIFSSPIGAVTGVTPQRTSRPPSNPSGFAQDRIIVKFKSSGDSSASSTSTFSSLASVHPLEQGRRMLARLAPNELAALALVGGTVTSGFERIGALVVNIKQPVGIAIEKLRRTQLVDYAEPDYERKINVVPNDPMFSSLWGMDNTGQPAPYCCGTADADIDAVEGWDITKNAPLVVVGLIDTGTDYNHEDLAANIWTNPGEIAGNGIDDDGNGWIDDVHGIDAFNNDGDPMDDHSHGTHTAGTIGAVGNNGIGVVGVAWQTKIMPLKFLSSGGYGYTSGAVTAIDYAISMKAATGITRMVLSNSWGGGGYDQSLYDAIAAANTANILFVAAAGNANRDTDVYDNYPSNYDLPNVVSVGATDFYDHQAYFSNFGCSSVDVFAPGVDVLSTVPGNSYAYYSGTSMATPMASGTAALLWQKYGGVPAGVKSRVLNSVDAIPGLAAHAVTQGRINLNTGLNAGAAGLTAVWGVQPSNVLPGASVTITGYKFGTTTGTVLIDGLTQTVNSWSDRTINITTSPSMPLGIHKVQVVTAGSVTSRSGACLKATYEETLIDKLIVPRDWAASAQVGNNLYIIGGGTNYGMTGAVEQYTLTTGRSVVDSAWDMPIPATNIAAAQINKKIYVVGGYDWNTGQIFNTLQIFDTTTKTWAFGPPLPDARFQSAAVAVGGKLYVFGGHDASFTTRTDVFRFDPSTNTWSTMAPMPTPRGYAIALQQGTSNNVWLIGGFAQDYVGTEVTSVDQFNVSTNKWVAKPAMNATRGGAGGAYAAGKSLALHGIGTLNGVQQWGRNDGELFITTWQVGVEGPENLYVPLVGKVNNDVYVAGGFNAYSAWGASPNVYRFTPQ